MVAAPYQAGNVPISGLPELPQNAITNLDELVIVDLSASETKKITASNFMLGMLALLPPGSINGDLITYPNPPEVDPNLSLIHI